MKKQPFIILSGLIGVGKTTLAKKISENMNIKLFYEPQIETEYGKKLFTNFLKNKRKYGYVLQNYLLLERFKQHQQIGYLGGGVLDRSLYEDIVFARNLFKTNNMTEIELEVYQNMLKFMSDLMPRKPDVLVYLDITPKEALERIKKRNRLCETSIPLTFLEELKKEYNVFVSEISGIVPFLRINYTNVPLDKKVLENICTLIKSFLDKKIKKISYDFNVNSRRFFEI